MALAGHFYAQVRIELRLAQRPPDLVRCDDAEWAGAEPCPMPILAVGASLHMGRAGGVTDLGTMEVAQLAGELMP